MSPVGKCVSQEKKVNRYWNSQCSQNSILVASLKVLIDGGVRAEFVTGVGRLEVQKPYSAMAFLMFHVYSVLYVLGSRTWPARHMVWGLQRGREQDWRENTVQGHWENEFVCSFLFLVFSEGHTATLNIMLPCRLWKGHEKKSQLVPSLAPVFHQELLETMDKVRHCCSH